MRRAGRPELQREHSKLRHTRRAYEDGHTRTHRPTKRTLRRHGGATRRTGISSVQLYGSSPHTAATALLDLLYQQAISRHTPQRTGRLAALQRADTEHWTALLPVDRDQARHLSRQGAAPAVSRAIARATPSSTTTSTPPSSTTRWSPRSSADSSSPDRSTVPRATRRLQARGSWRASTLPSGAAEANRLSWRATRVI